jgi:hypothetical protein
MPMICCEKMKFFLKELQIYQCCSDICPAISSEAREGMGARKDEGNRIEMPHETAGVSGVSDIIWQ